MTIADIIAPDFTAEPWWWHAAPPLDLPQPVLRPRYDVAIVGSGLTGLRTALDLARGGASVIVFEEQGAGHGASRRNMGFLGRTLKKSYTQLRSQVGREYATRVYRELDEALQSTIALARDEAIDCHLDICGRFIAANSANHHAALLQEMQAMKDDLGWGYRTVDSDQVASEMGSKNYHGGVVVPNLGSIHPGLFHKGLVERVLAAGAAISTRTRVLGMQKTAVGHCVETTRGSVQAAQVVVATNGYTPRKLKWHSRRVIPFTGFAAATEELPHSLLEELIPHGRTVLDSRTNIDFFRPAPDSPRLLFGGSTGSPLRTTEDIGRRLREILVTVFPQLAETRLSAIWSGECAATFDLMPHVGSKDGVHFGLGYNFAGVPMSCYFGEKIARSILGQTGSESVFGETAPPSIPAYNGTPWFVPLVMKYFDWKDDRLARHG